MSAPKTKPKKTLREISPKTFQAVSNIKMLMTAHNDSADDIALGTGINRQTLYRRFREPMGLKSHEIEALAAYWGMEVWELYEKPDFRSRRNGECRGEH